MPAASGAGRGGPARRLAVRYAEVLARRQTWKNLLYLLMAFPLGVAYFTAVTTMLATGGGLAVTLAGVPLLMLAMFAWCYLAEIERARTNAFLGMNIPPLGFADDAAYPWIWPRTKARLTNPMTWRALGLLLVRLPEGVLALVVTSVFLGVPLGLIATPILAVTVDNGSDFGVWRVDTLGEALPFLPAGIALIPLAFHGLNLAASFSAALTAAFLLGGKAGGGNSDSSAARALTWRGIRSAHDLHQPSLRLQAVQVRVFIAHFVIAMLVGTFFVLLNGVTSADTWWSLYVLWGISFLLLAHGGYLLYGWFGAHTGLFAAANAGFFLIDAVYSDNWWFFWPFAGWGLVLALHAWGDRALRRELSSTAGDGRVDEADHSLAPRADAQLQLGEPSEVQGQRGIAIDATMRRVTVDGAVVDLTPREFELLALLVQNPGRPFSRDDLLDRIWRNEYEVTDRTVDTHVQRLRRKLGPRAEAIQTVWGIGYRYLAE